MESPRRRCGLVLALVASSTVWAPTRAEAASTQPAILALVCLTASNCFFNYDQNNQADDAHNVDWAIS
jgi:hypothetical protein